MMKDAVSPLKTRPYPGVLLPHAEAEATGAGRPKRKGDGGCSQTARTGVEVGSLAADRRRRGEGAESAETGAAKMFNSQP